MPFIGRMGRPGLIGLAARTAVVAGTASAVGGAMDRRQQQKAAQAQAVAFQEGQEQQEALAAAAAQTLAQQQAQMQQTAPPAPAPAAPLDIVSRLQQLGELRAQGLLNDAEFEQAKAQLLGG